MKADLLRELTAAGASPATLAKIDSLASPTTSLVELVLLLERTS